MAQELIRWSCPTCDKSGLARPEWGGPLEHHAELSPDCTTKPQITPTPELIQWYENALGTIHKAAREAYEKHRDLTYLEICSVAEAAVKGPPKQP